MLSLEVWTDPRTWVAIGSLMLAIYSFFYGNLWSRRETRLDALSKVLQPMLKAAQHLHEANSNRRTAEQLKVSFPEPENAAEAVQRVNGFVEGFNDNLESGRVEFRAAEAEFASRWFRFPDRITRLVKTAMGSLSEYARKVNAGMCEQAELQFVKFRDDYNQIAREGRGWRLADPFEGIRHHFRKDKKEETPDRYELSEKDMGAIMDLVHKRATSQAHNTFAVHGPKKLLERPEIAKSDKVIEELEDSVFVVAFQDGTTRMMTLVELMMFTFNLIHLKQQMIEVERMMEASSHPGPADVQVSFRIPMDELMRPEMVKFLLDRIAFSDVPSDVEAAAEPARVRE
jgi:hypothetical protein